MRLGKFLITGGFVLLLSLFFFSLSLDFVLIILFAVLIHEAGHVLAIKILGGDILEIKLECMGVFIRYNGAKMSYTSELLAALAGPLLSILLSLFAVLMGKAFGEFWFTLAGFSLVLCALNLLPVTILDGGRMLYVTMAHCWDPDIADRASFAVSCVFSLSVMILGAWVLKESGWNFTLLLCGLWLFWGSAIVKKPFWV